jgi:hypothetical protein
MRSRRPIVGVLLLAIMVTGCDPNLFSLGSDEGSSEPGSLEGWRVTSCYRSEFQTWLCPIGPRDYLQGTNPSDHSSWAVGTSVLINPVFQRPCGLFTECLWLNATFSTSDQNVWQIHESRSSLELGPAVLVEAVGPGVGRIAVFVDGVRFGEVELRAVPPATH